MFLALTKGLSVNDDLMFLIFERTRPLLRGIGGHLAAVNRKELVAQKALFMAHQQHSFKQRFNLIGMATDKAGQCGDVGNGIAGKSFKNNIGLAAPLHFTTGGDAF